MIDKLKNIWKKIINFRRGQRLKAQEQHLQNDGLTLPSSESSISAKKKHDLIVLFSLGVTVIIGLIFMQYRSKDSSNAKHDIDSKAPLKLEVASSALDIDKMWRNHFEDKLTDAKTSADEKLKLIENSINEQSVSYTNQLKTEIEKLKAQIGYLSEEQALARREFADSKIKSEEEDNSRKNHYPQIDESRITVNHMDRGEIFDRPKSARSFIPETAYVKGILLGGIAVSTSIGSSSEPVPVVIRITDRGSLPKNFNVDLTHCKIMGSSYGDLSSERAIVRAEVLSCTDPLTELVYTTKIAGQIHGDDGMNGIKGKVVQTSGKHLKNAMIGGMISGFAGSAKGQDQMIITSFGTGASRKKGAGDMLKEGGFAGASNAAEKIADYYIKQAESMSPVLLVSGGTKVDVVFTKGVYLNALDVQEKLEQLRFEKTKK
ncbi:MAG: conjugal transfer protein TraB [Rickettsiaceae bacterium]|nr:conjugal transfer protein TraB [Rickettsiaceae bacterium]